MATNISIPTYGFVNHILALNEGNWRRFFKPFITDSVQNGLATIEGANMTVYVSAGECRCGAVMGILDEMIALDIANGDSTYDRIDSVVVQYTYGEPSTLAVAIVQGIPSANPVPPTLTKAYDTLWQMEIAQILVPSGATSASEFTITDKRVIYESIESIIDNNTESEERVWSSQKTHEEIVSLSTEIYDSLNTKADAITRTASGNIVTITDGGDNIPVKELVVGIEPVQEGTGDPSPENIRPISGWTGTRIFKTRKNLLNPANFNSDRVSVNDGVYTFSISGYIADLYSGQNGSGHVIPSSVFPKLPYLQPGAYTWSYKAVSGGTLSSINLVDKEGKRSSNICTDKSIEGRRIYTFTITEPSMITIVRSSNTNPTVFSEPQLELGSEFTGYEPYQQIQQATIQFPATLQNPEGVYYGGNVNLSTGILTIDRIKKKVGNYAWSKNTGTHIFYSNIDRTIKPQTLIICSEYKSVSWEVEEDNMPDISIKLGTAESNQQQICIRDDRYSNASTFKSDMSDAEFVYYINEPIIMHLHPQQISTLLGFNIVFADSGDILELIYRADMKTYVDEQVAEANLKTRQMMTTVTTEMVAPDNLVIGDIVIVNDDLYKVINSNIASGEAMVIGTNVEKITLTEYIQSLI